MVALSSTVQGNSIVVNDDIRNYDGMDVIITVLDSSYRRKRDVSALENDDFIIPSDRANHVDEYMREMRDDRI